MTQRHQLMCEIVLYNPNHPSSNRNPVSVFILTDKEQQCSDNTATLAALLRTIAISDGTIKFFWGGNPTTKVSHWYIQPGTAAYIRDGFSLGGNVTSQYARPATDGIGENPHFTYHSTILAGSAFYDPSYGIIESEVKLIMAVDSSGNCLKGSSANSAKVTSDSLYTQYEDFGYACGRVASLPRSSTFVSQSIPSDLEVGQTYPVSVTLLNSGDNIWRASESYQLGSQSPENNFIWGMNRVSLPQDVAPGEQVTFNFTITAPSNSGQYDFQWKMIQDGVEWFGEATPNVPIRGCLRSEFSVTYF